MLDKLPYEVLHLVLRNLATTPELIHYDDEEQNDYHLSNWKTLAQLCKVSRQLRVVAEPLLYRSYAKPDSSSDPEGHYSFRKFLATVLGRPELLQCIRSLYIGAWRHYTRCELQHAAKSKYKACKARVCDVHFPPELHSLYDKHAKASVLGDAWKEALDAGEEAAEIALLMSLTPNLERIEFCMPHLSFGADTAPMYFWPRLLVASADWEPSSHFHRLESVMIHKKSLKPGMRWPQPHEAGFEIDPFLPFIGLPQLKTFYNESDGRGFYRKRPEEYPINEEESHLTELTLGASYINSLELTQILKRCTKLEVFDCHFEQERSFIPDFSWNTVGEALSNSRHTLEEITLNADLMSQMVTEDSTPSEGTCVSIGSLRAFTSLKKLDVLQTTLLGFENMIDHINLVVPALPFEEILPSSLESLTIDWCSLTLVPYLEGMLTTLKEKFPRLREIQLSVIDLNSFNMNHDPWDQHEALMQERKDRVERLKQGFIKAGVEWIGGAPMVASATDHIHET
ncbi:unnamed protein product [Aureobasidium vineae]|uniref:Leucine-rich repeat domain-containing protein n=1 Tax=Aureobasidium vineae TaxID=2773715 RepID=A0A9N8K0M9_9PEZI|nr:unnamed protein product [Aureobasidium vineae]